MSGRYVTEHVTEQIGLSLTLMKGKMNEKGTMKTESNRLEFNRQLIDSLEREVVVLLNYRG